MFCSVRVSKYIYSFTDDSCLQWSQQEAAGDSGVSSTYFISVYICQVGGWM